jgi:flagellin
MPGTGGLSIANNLLANEIQLNLNNNENTLKKLTQQLSTGLRVNSPADDPSGFGIATNLETQIQGYDQGAQNIQTAQNATTVASGALTSITSILQQVRTLAVQASSNLLSNSDLNNVQSEISQLVGEVNSISQSTSFNGVNLLNGSYSGYVPAVNATASITQNSPLNSTAASLVGSVTYSNTDSTIADGTFEFQVIASNGTVATEVFYISSGVAGLSGTLLTTVAGPVATSYAYNDLTITINAVGTADIGSTAAIKVLKYVTAGLGTVPELTIQTGPALGDTVSFGVGNVSASSLRIGGLNVEAKTSTYNTLAAQDTIGQVDNALSLVLQVQSTIGSAGVRLGLESDNDNLASVNLQASESAIRDLNVASASSDYTKTQLLINFGTSLLAQANVNSQSVLTLFR